MRHRLKFKLLNMFLAPKWNGRRCSLSFGKRCDSFSGKKSYCSADNHQTAKETEHFEAATQLAGELNASAASAFEMALLQTIMMHQQRSQPQQQVQEQQQQQQLLQQQLQQHQLQQMQQMQQLPLSQLQQLQQLMLLQQQMQPAQQLFLEATSQSVMFWSIDRGNRVTFAGFRCQALCRQQWVTRRQQWVGIKVSHRIRCDADGSRMIKVQSLSLKRKPCLLL